MRKLITKLRASAGAMLSIDTTPRKMALACALGILVGISPYIGLQTYIAIALASLFRLPVYPLIVGVYITNPITIPFIFTATTKFGMWVLGIELDFDIDFAELNMRELLNIGKAVIVPFFVGTHLAGLILSVFTYIIVYYIMKRYKKPKLKQTDNGKINE